MAKPGRQSKVHSPAPGLPHGRDSGPEESDGAGRLLKTPTPDYEASLYIHLLPPQKQESWLDPPTRSPESDESNSNLTIRIRVHQDQKLKAVWTFLGNMKISPDFQGSMSQSRQCLAAC